MKTLRRIGIGLIGGVVLLAGIIMIVLPAPSSLVIPAGLAILAIEFAWARYCLREIRRFISERRLGIPGLSGSSSPAPMASVQSPGGEAKKT